MPPYDPEDSFDFALTSDDDDKMMMMMMDVVGVEGKHHDSKSSPSNPPSRHNNDDNNGRRRRTTKRVQFAPFRKIHEFERVAEEDRSQVWFTAEERRVFQARAYQTPWEAYWEDHFSEHREQLHRGNNGDDDHEDQLKPLRSSASYLVDALSLSSYCVLAWATLSYICQTAYSGLAQDDDL